MSLAVGTVVGLLYLATPIINATVESFPTATQQVANAVDDE